MTFPPFQFPFHGLPNEGRPVLAVAQDGIDAVKCPFREPGLHVLVPKFFSSHVRFFSYEVLTVDKSYEILASQSREMDMRIHWQGNFENEPMSGTVIARNGSLLTIRWDNGREQVIPEFVTTGHGWRRS